MKELRDSRTVDNQVGVRCSIASMDSGIMAIIDAQSFASHSRPSTMTRQNARYSVGRFVGRMYIVLEDWVI